MPVVGSTPQVAANGSLAERVAEVVGEAAWRLGIRERADEITGGTLRLIDEAATLYAAHPTWPSLLTDGGLPVELSLRLGRDGDCAFRCVADVTDQRAAPAENWTRYLSYASLVTEEAGAPGTAVWDLCRRHLDGVPETFASRMIHGLGYAPCDWYRGSLYFRTSWMDPAQLTRRLPEETTVLAEVAREHGAPVGGQMEVMGYDFVPGCAARWKAYSWAGVSADASFHELVGRHPDLEPARDIFETFRSTRRPGHPHPLLLQTSAHGGAVRQRLFFFGSAWGWTSSAALDRLLHLIDDRFEVDVGRLGVVADAAAARTLDIRIAMVAVGADDSGPSATFYLWPAEAHRSPRAARAPQAHARLEAVACRGTEYLFAVRDPDGAWRDHDGTDSDSFAFEAFVTAYTAAMVAVRAERGGELASTLHWLAARHQPGLGWIRSHQDDPDPETTALAVLALTRADSPLPPSVGTLLAIPNAAPDVAAALLLALVESTPDDIAPTEAALWGLSANQRHDGGWSCTWWDDDLVAVWRATRAFRVACGNHRSKLDARTRAAAASMINRASDFIASRAVQKEPFRLALWLGAAANVRRGFLEPRVARVVSALDELQQPDGSWVAAPNRRIDGSSSGRVYGDPRSIVTTATVVGALHDLLGPEPVRHRF